jgi:hypothetical protein
MLTCIACSKQLPGGAAPLRELPEDDDDDEEEGGAFAGGRGESAAAPSGRHVIKSLTAQVSCMRSIPPCAWIGLEFLKWPRLGWRKSKFGVVLGIFMIPRSLNRPGMLLVEIEWRNLILFCLSDQMYLPLAWEKPVLVRIWHALGFRGRGMPRFLRNLDAFSKCWYKVRVDDAKCEKGNTIDGRFLLGLIRSRTWL